MRHGPGDLLPVAEKSFVSQSHVYVHMAIWPYGDLIWFDVIGCDEHLFLRPIYPYIFDICFWIAGIYGPGIHVIWFMGVCRPDIYGYLVTRYLWVSVIIFLPEGKAVAKLLIVFPVLLNFPESLLTIRICFCRKRKQLLNSWSLFLFFFRIICLRFMIFCSARSESSC